MSTILTIEIYHLQREAAKRLVINKIKELYSKQIKSVKFVTGREKSGGRGIVENISTWMENDQIEHLIRYYKVHDGYCLVTLDSGCISYKNPIPKLIFLIIFLII